MERYINLDRYIERINREDIVEKAKNNPFLYEQGYLSGLIQASIAAKTMPTYPTPNGGVDWHREAELNAGRIIELEAELASSNSKVEGLTKLLDDKCDRCIERELAKVTQDVFADIEEHSTLLFDGVRNIVVMTETDFEKIKEKYTEEKV